MRFLEYSEQIKQIELSDYSALLNIARKWKKIDSDSLGDATQTKIAVLGSTSIQLIVSVTRALLCKYGIYANIYEGEYNGIEMDVFNDNSPLYEFHPDYVFIIPDYRDILEQKPPVMAEVSEIKESVDKTVNYYSRICSKIHQILPGCQILMSNFVEPVEDPLGSLCSNYLFSQSCFYRMVNIELSKNREKYTFIVDEEKIASNIGKATWFNSSTYYLSKFGFSLEYIGYFCDAFSRQIQSFAGIIKKCLVLDLDNTLWGGVVGDLGYNRIGIDPNDAEGEAFRAFQKYLLELKNRGVILAVCSKNDYENAIEPFEKNQYMILKADDISCFVANWNDKASNIVLIAKELNIGLDSLVFFDDNPTERDLVKHFLPEVKVIDVPEDPSLYVSALYESNCFDWSQITVEDVSRVKSYSDNKSRTQLLETCDNYDEFLKKLEMEAMFEQISDKTTERFAQLTNKSNQFNLRTMRYSEAEINQMNESPDYGLYTVSLKDKFTNYGVIACVALRFTDDRCVIENWVMSCRVLKKTVENFTMSKIVSVASNKGLSNICGEYIPSKKNSIVRDLYTDFGFETIRRDENGTVEFELKNIEKFVDKYKFIMKETET